MFTDREITEYLRRSYGAVDGLWFVKVEERHGFDEALRLDVAVWEILAKLQARKARELLGIAGRRPADLARALELKFVAEGYTYRITAPSPHRVEIEIAACPWLEMLRKSGREALAAPVAEAICPADFGAWAREFDPRLIVTISDRMCDGGCACRVAVEGPAGDGPA